MSIIGLQFKNVAISAIFFIIILTSIHTEKVVLNLVMYCCQCVKFTSILLEKSVSIEEIREGVFLFMTFLEGTFFFFIKLM